MLNGRVVIPPGSYVAGTITSVKRPGRVKGRGELYLRFDSLTLPNGVTRDFRARVGALDGRATEDLDKTEGKISPTRGALERALACAILSEAPHISLHTRAVLRSISRRLLDGEAVSRDEFRAVTYANFASTLD